MDSKEFEFVVEFSYSKIFSFIYMYNVNVSLVSNSENLPVKLNGYGFFHSFG